MVLNSDSARCGMASTRNVHRRGNMSADVRCRRVMAFLAWPVLVVLVLLVGVVKQTDCQQLCFVVLFSQYMEFLAMRQMGWASNKIRHTNPNVKVVLRLG